MAGKEPDIGPTARTVADNVKRLRTRQNMNYTELSERLQAFAGWSINAVGIRRIESGERRVTPDDLMGLAVALGVSPITLLMPFTVTANTLVRVTGVREPIADTTVWTWLLAQRTLDPEDEFLAFTLASWPPWMLVEFNEALESTLFRLVGDRSAPLSRAVAR